MSKVLLIEPNAVLARVYMQALQHAGHTAAYANNAQDAIDATDEFVPDVIVLELQLAVHDGIEFLHELRSYAEWQRLPVIINTHITPDALMHVKNVLEQDLGVKAWLYKPRTSLQQLISAVNEQAVSA